MQPITTFSIVAYDPTLKAWGVAVESKFLAVGAVVPWAQAGAGAVATQSYANLAYGPDGLDLMGRGLSAEETIETLIKNDEGHALRQVGVVDREGRAAAFTGAGCYDWAGHLVGDGFTCQGNLLLPGTIEAMAERFEQIRGTSGELADWLVEALAAGQAAGGDRRGRQSACVVVVVEGGGYGGNNDRYLDLRVDDDPYPIRKLQELVKLHHLYFGEVDPNNLIPLNDIVAELQTLLQKMGYYSGPKTETFDDPTRKALRALVGAENLEERWNGEGGMMDGMVVDYLREKFG